MAHDWDELPPGWSDQEADTFWQMQNEIDVNDSMLQALYHAAYFQSGTPFEGGYWGWERSAIRESLDAYVRDEYGIDFGEIHDWEAWREAYGIAG